MGVDFCTKQRLVELQNRTVGPRLRDDDYRTSQNYVGETVSWSQGKVHYACPKPEPVSALVSGLVDAHNAMEATGIAPVVQAATGCLRFRLHPPIRGRLWPQPSLPHPQHSCPPRKRSPHFGVLAEDEVRWMEDAVQTAYVAPNSDSP